MRGYLMGILCAAFLCAIVGSIGGAGQGTRKLICGIFLALALLHPLGSLDLPDLPLAPFLEEAEEVAENGQAQAQSAKNEIIASSLEAYILTKAQELDLVIKADVTLTDDGMPASVALYGSASPSEREAMTDSICANLGIGKEDIRWKEIYQSSE